MSLQTHKAIARSYFERLLNAGELDAAQALFVPTIRFHYPLGTLDGADAVKTYLAAVRAAFPDIRFTVEDLFAEGDRVAVRWRLDATRTGALRGTAPTGTRVEVPGTTIFLLRGGRIQEMWITFDPGRLLG